MESVSEGINKLMVISVYGERIHNPCLVPIYRPSRVTNSEITVYDTRRSFVIIGYKVIRLQEVTPKSTL